MSIKQNFPRIERLPDAVANQIAAGEVIERPASVVKELIENSIDSAATSIHVDIEQSGKGLIRVKDNGQGIHRDDLKLALEAHATSKLSNLSDLSQIASLGFRGEAIPSIASVSRFKMISRLAGQDEAWSIDNKLNVKPAAHEQGTTVEVNDLFFSTPGRRKFLKTDKTEFLHIQALIRAIALSHFSIGFFVKHNSQPLFQLAACQDEPDRRVLNICGRTFVNRSIRIDIAGEGLHLWGWLGLNDVSRSQSDRQYFFVNGRFIRDKHINHAIRLAYEDHIATGRFPSYILHLHIEPSRIDVNVHPAKSEIRFSDTRTVHDFIYSSLLQSLNQPLATLETEETYKSDIQKNYSAVNENISNYNGNQLQQEQEKKNTNTRLEYISLLNDRFIIAVIEKEQYLIDIYKARNLIARENLIKNYQTNTITQRPVLVPLSCELKQKDIDYILKQIVQIKRWGFEVEQITPSQVLIRSIPARLVFADTCKLFKSFITALKKNSSTSDIAETIAKHVNDAGPVTDEENLETLLNEITLFQTKTDISHPLPWKKLDSKILSSILDY